MKEKRVGVTQEKAGTAKEKNITFKVENPRMRRSLEMRGMRCEKDARGEGTHIIKKFLVLLVMISAMIVQSQEFSIQNKKENTIKGPFELRDGAEISLADVKYTLTDVGKFGLNSFNLESENNDKYGPFTAKNGSRIKLNDNQNYVIFMSVNKKQVQPSEQEEVNGVIKGSLGSDSLIKLENLLDGVEDSFTAAVRAPKEGQWLKEYVSKVNDLKLLSRKIQNELMKEGMGNNYNIPKYAISIEQALDDCRKDYVENKFWLKVRSSRRNNRSVSNKELDLSSSGADLRIENFSDCKNEFINQGIHDALANAARVQHSKSGKKISQKLSTGYQDLVLSVGHFREDIVKLEKTGKWDALKRNGKIYIGSGRSYQLQ